MNIAKAQNDKLVVGTTDVGYLPTDRNPVGTAVLNGPVFVGAPIAAPLYKAVLNVGPPAPPLLPGLNPPLVTPFSLWVDGLSNQVGIHLHAGVRVQKGMNFVGGSRITSGLNFTSGINITSSLLMGRPVMEGGHILSSKKSFDIPHPTKSGHRLRYVCTETPEAGVYVRGKSKSEVIELPDYWRDLVYEDSITVNLTPVGSFQHLYVQNIEDNKITVGGGLPSDGELVYNYHYTIFAERKDCERNISEYQGESPKDYPGDGSQCSVAGWDY